MIPGTQKDGHPVRCPEQVTVSDKNDNDVPALPRWGLVLLATILAGLAVMPRSGNLRIQAAIGFLSIAEVMVI